MCKKEDGTLESKGEEGAGVPWDELLRSAHLSFLAYHDPDHLNQEKDDAEIQTLAEQMKARGYLRFFDATEHKNKHTKEHEADTTFASTQAYAWVDQDEATAYLFYRGTDCKRDVLANMDVRHIKLTHGSGARVHRGFLQQFRAVEPRITRFLAQHCSEYSTLVCCGHSLGGALATLAAVFYAHEEVCKEIGTLSGLPPCSPVPEVRCHTFGSPRVGNAEFSRYFASRVPDSAHWRVFDTRDPVERMPFTRRFHHVDGNCLRYNEKGVDTVIHSSEEDMEGGCFCFFRTRSFFSTVCVLLSPPKRDKHHQMSHYIEQVARGTSEK